MEMKLTNGFCEMSYDEMREMDGGVAFLAIPLIEIAKLGITITVGHCLAAGSALGIAGGSVVAAKYVLD